MKYASRDLIRDHQIVKLLIPKLYIRVKQKKLYFRALVQIIKFCIAESFGSLSINRNTEKTV